MTNPAGLFIGNHNNLTILMNMELPALQLCEKKLKKHGFDVICVPTFRQASEAAMKLIEDFAPTSISYGDSITLRESGVLDRIRAMEGIVFHDGFDPTMERPEKMEIRRKGMIADVFLTGINAVSEEGTLHWTDMIGNRVAPVIFGPRHVILMVGKNKIVPTPQDAVERVRLISPLNAKRHEGFKTPCIHTGKCHECNSPDRLCNVHVEIARCFPPGRITVILVDKEGGF